MKYLLAWTWLDHLVSLMEKRNDQLYMSFLKLDYTEVRPHRAGSQVYTEIEKDCSTFSTWWFHMVTPVPVAESTGTGLRRIIQSKTHDSTSTLCLIKASKSCIAIFKKYDFTVCLGMEGVSGTLLDYFPSYLVKQSLSLNKKLSNSVRLAC